jgi:hypothetical protein
MNLLLKFSVVWAFFTIIGCSQKQMRLIEDVALLRCVDPDVPISVEDSMGCFSKKP